MSDSLQDRSDSRLETRRAREKRRDGEVSMPFNERVDVACPVCGEQYSTLILADPATASPSWGTCPRFECDAFLKYCHEREVDASVEGQSDLDEFGGGEEA